MGLGRFGGSVSSCVWCFRLGEGRGRCGQRGRDSETSITGMSTFPHPNLEKYEYNTIQGNGPFALRIP